MKNTLSEMNNSQNRPTSGMDVADEVISSLERSLIEINQTGKIE